ncbi:chymotrypsin inhibitor-like [Apis laboriosa]|uniref:chymotrypsin inhibitor-like n=1 Tax=Apis laboriosa TaxID=183418 RepID=UPI001CC7072A|nr:chymotrypsin inhibitor-like [Apis laboriosa]
MTRITVFLLLIVAMVCCCSAYPDRSAQSTNEECPLNEEFTSCGSECVDTCEKARSPVCNMKCFIGCQCKPGFVRNRENRCVLIRDC